MPLRYLIGIALLLIINMPTAKSVKPERSQCLKVAKKISTLDSKLRQANSVRRGERLKESLRALKKLRYQCRKYRLPTK